MNLKRTATAFLLLLCGWVLCAQEKRDSLVRLLAADKATIIEVDGKQYRKVDGHARFLHNDTYLICDSAYWNVEDNFIDAFGHVSVIQDKTTLTGDSLKYYANDNLACFRGHLVELSDKDSNILRTNFLDYNTKDSIATFFRGGAMRDKDGNVIESRQGNYFSKEDLFLFVNNVNMFSDSLFMVSDTIRYNSKLDVITFSKNTNAWQNENALKCNNGWYNRNNETYYFENDVHILTEDYEVWCEKLYYDRDKEYSQLVNKVQVVDTVDNVILISDELKYWNDPRRVDATKNPVLIMIQQEKGKEPDSIFVVSDRMIHYTQRMYEIDSAFVEAAIERRELTLVDPLESKRPKKQTPAPSDSIAAPPDSLAADSTITPTDSLLTSRPDSLGIPLSDSLLVALPDSLSQLPDSTVLSSDSLAATLPDTLLLDKKRPDLLKDASIAPADSGSVTDSVANRLKSVKDSIIMPEPEPPLDTTTVKFVQLYNNVKIYKKGLQVRCDSLLFCSIDSIARLFKDPVIWYDDINQVTADSMQFLIKDQTLDKGYMLSNAFVISDGEDGMHYHQIKSPEMIGYFEGEALRRFDAIGGVSMIIFLSEEDSVISTMNQKECRMMTAQFADGYLQRMRYYENIKSDVFPVYDLTEEKKFLKDFNWMKEEQYKSRNDIFEGSARASRRAGLTPALNFPRFTFTNHYFNGYMDEIFRQIDERKPLKWVAAFRRRR